MLNWFTLHKKIYLPLTYNSMPAEDQWSRGWHHELQIISQARAYFIDSHHQIITNTIFIFYTYTRLRLSDCSSIFSINHMWDLPKFTYFVCTVYVQFPLGLRKTSNWDESLSVLFCDFLFFTLSTIFYLSQRVTFWFTRNVWPIRF